MDREIYGPIKLQLALLATTFVFGIIVNLFLYEAGNPNASVLGLPGAWIITIHVVLGVAIFLNAVAILFKSFESKDQRIRYPALLAAVFLFASFIGGLGFLFENAPKIFSFLMAMGFLLSLGAYVVPFGLLLRRR